MYSILGVLMNIEILEFDSVLQNMLPVVSCFYIIVKLSIKNKLKTDDRLGFICSETW